MSFSIRRSVAAAAIAIGAMGAVASVAPAANAVSVLWHPTVYVWTGQTALASCQAFGQQQVASGNWDAYRCQADTPVAPDAIQAWMGVWIGCNTCVPLRTHSRHTG